MSELVLSNRQEGVTLTFPSNPERVAVNSSGSRATVAVEDLGSIPIPIGREPTSYSWSGTLYGPDRAGMPHLNHDYYRLPIDFIAQIDNWVDAQVRSKQPLSLVLTDSPINKDVFISTWNWEVFGGMGDYSYTIELVEARIVSVTMDGEEVVTVSPDGEVVTETLPPGEGGEEPPIPATYTVREGDYLISIACRVYGDSSRWRDIYQANQEAIGPNPDLIYPGTVLNIPDSEGTDLTGTLAELNPLESRPPAPRKASTPPKLTKPGPLPPSEKVPPMVLGGGGGTVQEIRHD